MQGLDDTLVVLELISDVLVFLQQRLDTGLIAANIITGHQPECIQHPSVHVISISEELVEVNSLRQPFAAVVGELCQVGPLAVDLISAILDLLLAKVVSLDQVITHFEDIIQVRVASL